MTSAIPSRARTDGPASARGVVARKELSDRLSAAPPDGVTVVWAPAGSGKTTLLRSWLHHTGEPAAWVSVERGEQDAQRFWLSIVDAVAEAAGEDGPVERIGPSPTFAGESVVTRLLAGLRALDHPIVVVLDDLHEVASHEALHLLEIFVAHLPPTVRLVLATREDPRLGLHRLRVAGMLTELRGSDLAFSPREARELLERSGVELSAEAVTLLSERTEGWAAGLRLAALSLAGHPDPERFVREFSGSERTVAAYLMAEVLEHQPPEVRELLLRTAVLDRVNAALADHLTASTGSQAILSRLADANAFVTPIDAGRTWFRYHHLFADLLRMELGRTAPEMIDALHRAAADWHEEHGDAVAAITHAQAGRDWDNAARLLVEHAIALILDARPRTVRALLDRFPRTMPAERPDLALVAAAARVPDAALQEAVGFLDIADRLEGEIAPEHRPRFELERAVVRAALARRRSDLPTVLEAMAVVEAALRARPGADVTLGSDLRASALMDLGIAEIWWSRPDDARRDLEEAAALARRLERPYLEIAALGHLALATMLSGRRLPAALELAGDAEAVADRHGLREDPVVATACAVSAGVLVWQGRFDEAEPYLDRAERTVRSEGEPATEMIVHQTRGELHLAQGRFEDALRAFGTAERVQARLAGVQPLSIEPHLGAALAHARMGDVAAARAALEAVATDGAGVRTAAAAIDLLQGAPERAVETLAPVFAHAPDEHEGPVMLEALLLDAAAHAALGDRSAAEAALERALDAAHDDGILLPFLTLPLGDLLERRPPYRSAHPALLAEILAVRAGRALARRKDEADGHDELSEAELRVARFLPTNLKTSEIAAELFVSTNTVRTHMTHIYRKLGAHSRSEAVARARELGLIGSSARR